MVQQEITIPNINKTYKGTEYAYEKEGIHDTKYLAECIEYGEQFYSTFYAPRNYSKEQLMEIGFDLASEWGGECYAVNRVVKDNGDGTCQVVPIL